MFEILVVSDATGSTAGAVATSAMVQFPGAPLQLRRFPFTRTMEQVDAIVEQAAEARSVIVFTCVSRDLAEYLIDRSERKNVPVVDLLSPLMGLLATSLNHAPDRTPGALRGQTEDMFLVTEAIAYTLRHDDGGGLETIKDADLVILGVSRTGKTPTSIYLSCRKLKVANVPIILDMPLPDEVLEAPGAKVGFRMDLERLVVLRAERFEEWGRRGVPGYADRRHIAAELEFCERLFRATPGLVTVDVTDRSIEETSDWITRQVL